MCLVCKGKECALCAQSVNRVRMRIITLYRLVNDKHSVFFEQSKNVHYVTSL